jgi:hypothetical protein
MELTGVVVRVATGEPVSDASVLVPALQLRLVTDPEGRFHGPEVCPDTYRVRITHLGFGTHDEEHRLGDPTTPLRVELRMEAVELEGLRVEVSSVMRRLEDRRSSYSGRSAAFDWREFDPDGIPGNIPEWVAQRAGVAMIPCGDTFWTSRNCFQGRHGMEEIEVCVNETATVVTPSAVFHHYPREEIGRAEFYRRDGLMKIYTKEFLARAALSPWMIRHDATQC